MVLFRRLHQTLDRIDATIDRNTRAFEDLQAVIRETRSLEDRALQRFEATMDRISADVNAHTEAIWRLLDRWGEGPSPAS